MTAKCGKSGIHHPHTFLNSGVQFPCDGATDKPTVWNDALCQMMDRQNALQRDSFGHDFTTMTEEERVLFARDQILALLDEMHEALAEIGWKPWATSRHMNRDAFVGELVDAWHFLMNLLLSAHVTPEEFFSLYVAKNEKNARRQNDGYDGVSTKCPGCKRAYDDTAVLCSPSPAYCEKKGFNI